MDRQQPQTSKAPSRALRPKDAATIIILRSDHDSLRILMGKRHSGHAFMPGKYVFPGGRVDAADYRLRPAIDLHPAMANKLLARMRGRPSAARARGLAMAAVRETFEEVGLIIGSPHDGAAHSRSAAWHAFLETGYAPDLSGLRYFARAITPPGRPRRFDSRFFVLDARHVVNCEAPVKATTEELLDPCWVSFDEALDLDLPNITKDILRRLRAAFETPDALEPGAPLPFQYSRAGSWHIETI